MSGDNLIVGAISQSDPYTHETTGSATIFKRNTSTNLWQSGVTFYGGTQNGNYGYSVSISGNVAAVSDPEGSPYNCPNCGRVNFLYKNPQEVWSKGQFNFENTINSNFGNSISLSGDYLIIGDNYTINGGIAKIYKKVNSIWIQVQEFGAPQPSNTPEEFGYSVAIDASSNRFLIGARSMQKFGMAFFGKVK